MKTLLTIAATLAVAAGAYAQGNIKFQNGTTTAVRFSSDPTQVGAGLAGLKVAPGSAFVVGLYLGNAGTAENGLQLFRTTSISTVATGTAHAAAGLFNGGNPLVVTGFSSPDVAFMVKAWTIGFTSYEAALMGNPTTTYAGKSTLGSYTLKGVGVPVTDIMAATPTGGQVGAFSIALVPEPATASLLGLGLASLLIFRRRK